MGHAMMADLWRALEAPTLLGLGPTSATLTLDHQRLIGGEIELLVEAGRHTLEVAGPRGVRARTIVGDPARPTLLSAAELRPSPRPGSSSEPGPASAGPSIAELRDRASDARATLQWRLAAESYEALITRYPGSPEAQNARVQLGDLLRARLGQPARALVYFEAYLQGGGPLAAEARVGRVLALQQLGRRDDEAAAIADYLDHHPDHIEASKLRQRQRELAGP